MDRELLLIRLMESRRSHLHRMQAIALSGWVIGQAEQSTNDEELAKAVTKLNECLQELDIEAEQYLSGLLLFNLVSEVELYFTDIVKHVILAYPKKLGSVEFRLSEILDKPRSELVQAAADNWLNALFYKKPSEYLERLSGLLAVPSACIGQTWPRYIEAKARRDLGIHCGWTVNETYLRKTSEAGFESDLGLGDQAWPSHSYVQNVWDTCASLVDAFGSALESKHVDNV
ncbi:hypothetical protein [Wenzhouxiangella sp. EGI_FJ10305]|uniref:hypothetical protein n=1 Tax=Wenzhouxiangella sp. EGI_FJ10305 TaxID=3243768 RepID=UPI0035E250E8